MQPVGLAPRRTQINGGTDRPFDDCADEAKTRIICSAASPPDSIFFPDAQGALASADGTIQVPEDNPLSQDMFGEVMQDLSAPFRPNISSYQSDGAAGSAEEQLEAAAAEAALALERVAGTDQAMEQPGMKSLAIFTGQDEQFAYRRALSRIYEMTSREYVKTARWTPIPADARVWEHATNLPLPSTKPVSSSLAPKESEQEASVKGFGGRESVDPAFPHAEPKVRKKPLIDSSHMWGVVDNWGAKAGRWGKGVKAYEETTDGGKEPTDKK